MRPLGVKEKSFINFILNCVFLNLGCWLLHSFRRNNVIRKMHWQKSMRKVLNSERKINSKHQIKTTNIFIFWVGNYSSKIISVNACKQRNTKKNITANYSLHVTYNTISSKWDVITNVLIQKKKIQLACLNNDFRFGRLWGIFLFLEFGNLSYSKHS